MYRSTPPLTLFFLVCLLLSVRFASGQPVMQKEKRDSVYTSLYMLMDAGKYTEAHDRIVANLYVYRDDKPFSAALYLALSDVERLTGNNEIAFAHVHRAETIMHAESDDYWQLKKNTVYQRLGNLYFETRQYDSAFHYAQAAIQAAQTYNPAHLLNMKLQNLPIVAHQYFLEGKYTLAEDIYRQVIDLSLESGRECDLANLYQKMSEIKAFQNKPKEAVIYAEKAYVMGDTCGFVNYKLAAVNRLIWLHQRFSDYKKVAEYLQLKMDLLEETQLHQQKTRLQEMETRFGTKLKEEENRSLKAINREQEVRSRLQWLLIGLSVLMLAIMTAFAFSYWKQKSRISKQKEEVERLNRLNQKIFSVISHDFKGPMLGIDTLLGMYDRYGMDPETFAKQTRILRSDLSQANLVMENLLNWSRTELGYGDYQKNMANVSAVWNEVGEQLRAPIAQKNLRLQNVIPTENELPLPPDVLRIILRNLLANAVKYSYAEGRVTFSYDAAENTYVLRDEGTGMDEERRNRLFVGGMDSRLGTHRESGYGIGLQLVHELVKKYKGHIRIESAPGHGTSVYFTFSWT